MGHRVLIVEDEALIAMDLHATLSELGYEVLGTATTAGEALYLAGRERPDVVLMDVKLRGAADGVHAAGMLRDQLRVPVVFLTANADNPTLRRALEAGAGGFLAKPFEKRSLEHALEVALGQAEQQRSLRLTNSLLEHASSVDALTGLFNRRYLEQTLDRALEFAGREGHEVGVLLLDLDHFKAVNDVHGHAAGDAVLRGVARLVLSRVRIYDTACRYGGEELVIVVPGAGVAQCEALAESLRSHLAAASFTDGGNVLPSVTASIGIATFPEHGKTTEDLLRAADGAMYEAKAAGRNRVQVAHR
ncbi:MAG TPA: diguanylate cyclase [Polyangiaceae bacterium]|nr:diguanylate cyclase [Polyangiaceae bacterium]